MGSSENSYRVARNQEVRTADLIHHVSLQCRSTMSQGSNGDATRLSREGNIVSSRRVAVGEASSRSDPFVYKTHRPMPFVNEGFKARHE